jgi:hypothetical protein
MTLMKYNKNKNTRTYPREGITPGQPGIPVEGGKATVDAKRDDATAAAAHTRPILSHLPSPTLCLLILPCFAAKLSDETHKLFQIFEVLTQA